MSQWSEYKQKVFRERYSSTCEQCTLKDMAGPVWGTGDPSNAKIIYIAQNPGVHEIEARPMEPLVGPSGRVFNRQLAESGLRRSDLYITNQVKCLTPGNREPSPGEIKSCRGHLETELGRCRADTVLLAGDVAFRAHLERYSTISNRYHPANKKGQPIGIMTRMGCIEQKEGRKWIGTIHPAFIMRVPDWRAAALDHLRKANNVAGVAVALPTVVEHPSDSDVLRLVDYICLESREFADDVETHQDPDTEEDDYVGGDYQMDMCGIGGKAYEALVVEPNQVHLLEPAFADPTIWRYEHNGAYDDYHIGKVIRHERNCARKFDTMLATHYLRSHAPKKLKPFVVSQYTSLPYYGRDLEKVGRRLYNGMDVIATFLAAKTQRRELKEQKLEELFFEFGMPLLPLLEEIRVKGCNVDIKKALLFKQMTEAKIAKAGSLIGKICGPMFNPRSDQQCKALFYEHWKFPVQTKEVRNGREVRTIETIDFEARKRLRWWVEKDPARLETHKQGYYLLQLLDYLSGEEKKLEYIGRISGDGRIHPYFKAHGEKSFRLSSSPNLQNFPVYGIEAWGGARRDDNKTTSAPVEDARDSTGGSAGSLRSMVIPDHPEDVFLSIDYAQLQLALYAAQFNAKWLLDIYEKGEYVYGIIYEEVYHEKFFQEGLPKTKANKLKGIPEQRIRRAKAVPLGFIKGRSMDAVAEEYGSVAEATRIRNWWFGVVPEFARIADKVKYQLNMSDTIRFCFGHIIHFPSKKLTEALDAYGQSIEPWILIGSLLAIDREFKARNYINTRIVLTVHDSLTINVPEHKCIEVYEEIVAPVLNRSIPQLGGFRLKHEAEVERMWSWDSIPYEQWKSTYTSRGSSLAGDQSLRDQGALT